jgi:hypothetical protein
MAVESSPWLGQILKFCPNLIHLDVAGNDVDEGSSQVFTKACVRLHAQKWRTDAVSVDEVVWSLSVMDATQL